MFLLSLTAPDVIKDEGNVGLKKKLICYQRFRPQNGQNFVLLLYCFTDDS